MSNDATEYCWWIDEMPHGPFPSRAVAIEEAADYLGSDFTGAVWLGPVVYVDAARYVAGALDADELLERADEEFMEVCSYEDQVFYASDEAKTALRSLLEAWAREHVGTNCVWHCPSDAPDVADEVRAMARAKESKE